MIDEMGARHLYLQIFHDGQRRVVEAVYYTPNVGRELVKCWYRALYFTIR
jgi:hypothetical protein